MRIITPALAVVLGLAVAPVAALAQASNVSVPPPNPKASVTSTSPVTSVGARANKSVPTGGPGVNKAPHAKTHKRTHHKAYGKHYDYTRGGTKKGPSATHEKPVSTN
jgi:hypothetical protein